ncbi:S-layer homology domain-containing protein [Citricoccus zhacaiensis]|uniref:S-layer homology domain-containing protein n=1 Tax=Citricoccus zhacaiensis TaxID=489142 RepID=UPI003CEC0279
MVADHTSTPRRTAPTASTEDAPRTGRRRLARALTAVAASGALLVPAAGAAVAAPATDAPAAGSEAACLAASFPAGQTWTTAAAVDEWLACVGLSNGEAYADPGITRGEAAQIAYRAVGADEPAGASVFADVAPGSDSATAITWLANAGIVRGYGDGEFKADRAISRDELAIVLVGAALTGAEAPAGDAPAAAAGDSGEGSTASEATADSAAAETTADPAAAEAPTEAAVVGNSAATAYKRDAAAFMEEYGCKGTALTIVKATSIDGATGVTSVTSGQPASVQIRSGLDEYQLEHTAAHECMHVLQHAVADYDFATLDAMLQPYYSEDLVTSWGAVDIYEQNAECAVRSLGFPQEYSSYDVACTEAMLDAGQAIALGHDPREVVAAG